METTDRDRETLEHLKRLTAEKGYPPSVRELAAALGLASMSAAHRRLERIISLGWAQREPGQSRTLRITDEVQSR